MEAMGRGWSMAHRELPAKLLAIRGRRAHVGRLEVELLEVGQPIERRQRAGELLIAGEERLSQLCTIGDRVELACELAEADVKEGEVCAVCQPLERALDIVVGDD